MSAYQPVRAEERSYLLTFGAEKGRFVIPLIVPNSFLKSSQSPPYPMARQTFFHVACVTQYSSSSWLPSYCECEPSPLLTSGCVPQFQQPPCTMAVYITCCYFSFFVLTLNRKVTKYIM